VLSVTRSFQHSARRLSIAARSGAGGIQTAEHVSGD
jgi:hypothetical protein